MRKSIIFHVLFMSISLYSPNLYAADHIKTCSLPYGTEYMSQPLRSQVAAWEAGKFDYIIAGGPHLSYNPNIKSIRYQTIIGTYSAPVGSFGSNLIDMKAYADQKGWNAEDMLVHMNVDFVARRPWSQMDKYLIILGSTNITTNAYNAADTTTINDTLYVGHEDPFDRVIFDLRTGGQAYSGVWEYWNGNMWTALSVSDGTSGLSGNGQVTFTPPSTWKRSVMSVADVNPKWWVRLRFVGATTAPVMNKLNGDDWHSSVSGKNCRGWDENSASIVNNNTVLAYNPTPPSHATAHFRHQGRATGYWSANYIFYHPENESGGIIMSADYSSNRTIQEMTGYNGVMFDSAAGDLTLGITSPSSPAGYSDVSGSWTEVSENRYAYVIDMVHATFPDAFAGGNVYPYARSFIESGDFALFEYHSLARQTSSPRLITVADSSGSDMSAYDDYRPVNNSQGVKGLFLYNDTVYWDSGRNFYWDRSNRGPMSCLSKHYIGQNENTVFGYYSEGGWRYDFADEIFYTKTTTTLTADLAKAEDSTTKAIHGVDFSTVETYPYFGRVIIIGEDVLNVTKTNNTTLQTTSQVHSNHSAGETIKIIGVKHQATDELPAISDVFMWSWSFPAMWVDIGVPDGSGHNGGQYDLNWKSGSQIGGGQDVWRRDYTKAIILHRPAVYNTTKAEYFTYSSPIDLGGTYYPLYADGSTGEAITQIALRAGEGAILLKAPGNKQTILLPPVLKEVHRIY